jgi:hypothetical protein
MADQIVLVLPDEIAARARQIAESNAISVEQVLIDYLKTLPFPLPQLAADEQAELDALHHLSDDALWTIAREQMPRTQQERFSLLLALNKRSALTQTETAELDDLLERSDRLTLRKAEAAALLTTRGYKVMPQQMAAPHE